MGIDSVDKRREAGDNISSRLATLEEAKKNQDKVMTRFFDLTWPAMENTLKEVSGQLAEAKLDRAGMKTTLTGLEDRIKDLSTKENVERLEGEVEEVRAVAKSNEATISSWKSKGTVIGFGIIAIITIGFNLLGEGLKKWIGLK